MHRILRVSTLILTTVAFIGCAGEEGPSAPKEIPKATGNTPAPAPGVLSPDMKPPKSPDGKAVKGGVTPSSA